MQIPKSYFLIAARVLALAAIFFYSHSGFGQNSVPESWAYKMLNLPDKGDQPLPQKPILIAVIDDAFNTNHPALRPFLYRNPQEIPGNFLDDDGNGYIDDNLGYDVADLEPDVNPPSGREKDFYHGTQLAGLIVGVANRVFGERAPEFVRILPVKVVSDEAKDFGMKGGYKGISFALANHADIICMAWSGGNLGKEETSEVVRAHREGVLFVGASGNMFQEIVHYPAEMKEVVAIAALNQRGERLSESNYGMSIDFSLPGDEVDVIDPVDAMTTLKMKGTSPATALFTGLAGCLWACFPEISKEELLEALKNTAVPYGKSLERYSGKLGAGIPNVTQAYDYLKNDGYNSSFSPLRSQGVLNLTNERKNWRVAPFGGFHGYELTLKAMGVTKKSRASFQIFQSDSLWQSYSLQKIPAHLFVPGGQFQVKAHGKWKKTERLKMTYRAKPIDSTTLFCSGIQTLQSDSGTVSDGSKEYAYANNCSCKWQISAPAGKRVQVNFTHMHTQPGMDYVYLVDGRTARPQNIIAKFSGRDVPPEVTSRTNEVLIWFVTDAIGQGKGWELQYFFVD